jgi:hypothetical protein
MKTTTEPFNTGDPILDEMLELKRQAADAQDFNLQKIACAARAAQSKRGAVTVNLHDEARRKFNELQALSKPR